MKITTISLSALLLTGLFAFAACTKPDDVDDDNSNNQNTNQQATPPSASFSFSPNSNIIADETLVSFINGSTGTISSNFWHFGAGETTSSSSSPSYRFDREGFKTIRLTVSGSAGTDNSSVDVRVHAMDPTLHNYTYFSTQSEGHIDLLRQNGLKIGRIKVHNNYNSGVRVVLYHPDSWLLGDYSKFAQWSLPPGTTYFLNYDGQNINIGNDWGIQVVFDNGVKSCIRSLHYVSDYNNGVFNVKGSEVYNGG